MIAYADDVVIATKGVNQVALADKTTNEWAKSYNMHFNQEKSKIMLHNHVNSIEEGETYKNIKVVKKVKVLGFMMDSHSNNLEHVKYIEKKNRKS